MEKLISCIDSAVKNGWISQAVEGQSHGQTSQTLKGTTENLLVSAVLQGQQCPGNCSRNSMQGHEHTSNGFRNSDLEK